MYTQSHSTYVMWLTEISLIKKKLSFFKEIKLNKVFLKFLPILHLNQKNISLNQINNLFHFKKEIP